jgi:uncharacterized alkaline shock family protein YloU
MVISPSLESRIIFCSSGGHNKIYGVSKMDPTFVSNFFKVFLKKYLPTKNIYVEL